MLAVMGTDDLNTVRQLEQLRIQATRENDADVLAPLLHEQLIYVNSIGAVFDKNRYLKSIRSHSLTYDRDFDVRETEVRVLDDVIILAGMMLGHSRLDGEQQVFHFPCIGVWRKDPDQWRVRAGHCGQVFASSGAPVREIARADSFGRRRWRRSSWVRFPLRTFG
jgi:ketosteroid isomerase-like protein